jgi:protein TonB
MRIDRYVHAERPTWGAAGVLLLVASVHAVGLGRLLLVELEPQDRTRPPVFEVSLQRLPPPKLPQELERRAPEPSRAPADQPRQKPRLTRPVPILVDTPTTDPVPPGTAVKQYEIGDELLPGVPGPPMPEGALDGVDTDYSPPPATQTALRPVSIVRPDYPPSSRRLGIEGTVRVRVLVGADGRPREVTVKQGIGDAALDEAALLAVRRWRFEPARRNGEPVAATVVVPIQFRLVDEGS